MSSARTEGNKQEYISEGKVMPSYMTALEIIKARSGIWTEGLILRPPFHEGPWAGQPHHRSAHLIP